MKIQKSKYSLLFFVILLCSFSDQRKFVVDQKALNKYQKIWTSNQIKNYTVTQKMTCYCSFEATQPKVIEVRNGKVFSVDGNLIPAGVNSFKTIDDYFELITKKSNSHPFAGGVKYNTTYGFPTTIFFDMNERMADDEVSYTLTDFTLFD